MLYCLKLLLDNPKKFGLETRSFYFQTNDTIFLYRLIDASKYKKEVVGVGQLDEKIPLLADMETSNPPKEHLGFSLIFTSFMKSRYKEITKGGWRKILPTWSSKEQIDFFQSEQFKEEYNEDISERAKNNIQFYGGSIRLNIESALERNVSLDILESALQQKGLVVCEQFFKAGFGGVEDAVSDVLIHRNPVKIDSVGYNFNAISCTYSFASTYVFDRLMQLHSNILLTDARNKYRTGTFRGGSNGEEFELLCLHGFTISGVEFAAYPLSSNTSEITIVFPPKAVLARNWKDQKNYLQADLLYIPSHGIFESADAFCLIKIEKKWTLVILQCTIAERHPVKQNGIKVICDRLKKSGLKVDEIAIIFMVPRNSKLNTTQSLVTDKKDATTLPGFVTKQYKIENRLSDIREA